MILTLISVANACIISYRHHPNKPGDLWECWVLGVGLGEGERRNTVTKNKVLESLT